jgi:hypothetical protein
MVESFSYKDESEYQKEVNSIKEIILRHIKKIGEICCQEFTGGYWNKKPMRTQGGLIFSQEYHEDKRESYCNAIDFLIDIIYPCSDKELKETIDKEEKKEITEIKEKLKQRRFIFKEINKMFERTNFWQQSDSIEE